MQIPRSPTDGVGTKEKMPCSPIIYVSGGFNNGRVFLKTPSNFLVSGSDATAKWREIKNAATDPVITYLWN